MAIYKVTIKDRTVPIEVRRIKADGVRISNKAVFYNKKFFRKTELVYALSKWDEIEKTTEEDEFIDNI